MLDLHCHILPAVDDGPRDLPEALDVARRCAADGITHVTATPHCHRFVRLLRPDILPHVERFNRELARAGVALTVLPGSEIQLTDVDAYHRDDEAGLLCHLGGGRSFTLLEFPWQAVQYPAGAAGHVTWLRGRGTTPILAHPERHGYFRDDPARLRGLVEAGAWLQITVDSLLGRNGPHPREAAEELLRTYPDAVLATDAHRPERCSGLAVGYQLVADRLGPERSADLRMRSDGILRRLLEEAGAG
jgi:protein-tyrosine phosphatase